MTESQPYINKIDTCNKSIFDIIIDQNSTKIHMVSLNNLYLFNIYFKKRIVCLFF